MERSRSLENFTIIKNQTFSIPSLTREMRYPFPYKLRNVRTQSEAESQPWENYSYAKRTFPLEMNNIYVSEHLEQELNFVT